MANNYNWLVGKTYHGCNDHPYRDVQDGRLIKVLAVGNDLPGALCFSGGDRPASDTARAMLDRNAVGKPKALVETTCGTRTWVTAAKWVATEVLRQYKLGWLTICPDCGSTDTITVTECETVMGECHACGIWFEVENEQVQHDQARQARGLAPDYPLADLLEHGPIDVVD